MPFEAPGKVDRPMASAGAAKTDRELRFSLAVIARDEKIDEAEEMRDEGRGIGNIREVGGDRRVVASERLQFGDVVRIGKEAHVEDEIAIQRNAVFESERDERDVHAARLAEERRRDALLEHSMR